MRVCIYYPEYNRRAQNILHIFVLQVTLPFSKAKLERMFSPQLQEKID